MTVVNTLYAGTLRALEPEGQQTGIYKYPIEVAEVTSQGIVGDHQADRRYHGGPDKALHEFARPSYATILADFPFLRARAVPGSIGENISSSGLTDSTVCIGDTYRIGQVIVQVSQPRKPCWKINHRFKAENLSVFIEQRQVTGWYYRVLEAGSITAGDQIILLERLNEAITVAYFIQHVMQHRPGPDELNSLIEWQYLNAQWKAKLKARRKYLASLIER